MEVIKITFHYRYRKQIIIAIIITCLVLGTVGSYYYIRKNKGTKKDKNTPQNAEIIIENKTEDSKVETNEENMYKVDIKGQVLQPGIYMLPPSSRVIDVITKAGGLTENANTTVLNLSKKITDEMVIIVYSNEEVNDFTKTKEQENIIQEKCRQKDENALKNDACICNDSNNSEDTKKLVSINTATIEELMTLPGIGEAKAQDIINYRNEQGPFQKLEDIKNISGIGESLFAKIKDSITL